MADLEKLRVSLRAFTAARDWQAFHSPKNLAAALSVEAAELLEVFAARGTRAPFGGGADRDDFASVRRGDPDDTAQRRITRQAPGPRIERRPHVLIVLPASVLLHQLEEWTGVHEADDGLTPGQHVAHAPPLHLTIQLAGGIETEDHAGDKGRFAAGHRADDQGKDQSHDQFGDKGDDERQY